MSVAYQCKGCKASILASHAQTLSAIEQYDRCAAAAQQHAIVSNKSTAGGVQKALHKHQPVYNTLNTDRLNMQRPVNTSMCLPAML